MTGVASIVRAAVVVWSYLSCPSLLACAPSTAPVATGSANTPPVCLGEMSVYTGLSLTIIGGSTAVASHLRCSVSATTSGVAPSVMMIFIVTMDVPGLSSPLPRKTGRYM